MKRLMFYGSLPLSVAAPVAVVIALIVFQGRSDQKTINLPVSATAAGAGATQQKTVPFKLFDGKTVYVDRSCADSHHLGSEKQAAVTAAEALPPPKQVLLNRKRDFRAFLKRHPEGQLAPAVYAVYKRLRSGYEVARKRYNHQIDVYNVDVEAYNATLKTCSN